MDNYYRVDIIFINKSEYLDATKMFISDNNLSAIKAVEKYINNEKQRFVDQYKKTNIIIKPILDSVKIYLYNISKPNEDGSIDSGLGGLIFNWYNICNCKTFEETIREKQKGFYIEDIDSLVDRYGKAFLVDFLDRGVANISELSIGEFTNIGELRKMLKKRGIKKGPPELSKG